MSSIPVPDLRDEDEAFEREVQRKLDDEAEAKRRASGFSPEQMSLDDAFLKGQRAGSQQLSPSLNPFQDGTPEHTEWERGWHAGASVRGARMIA